MHVHVHTLVRSQVGVHTYQFAVDLTKARIVFRSK